MLTNSTLHAPPTLPLQSSKQPSNILRWFGNATLAFVTLAGTAYSPESLSAQQAEPMHQPGRRVAVIDVEYIFWNLPAIKTHFSGVKAKLRKEELELKRRRDALKQAVEHLEKLSIGSDNYFRQEEHVAKLESQLRLHRVHKHRELNQAEARLYYDSYQQIAAATQAVAIEQNIHLVLHSNSEEMDLAQRDSVFRGVMNHVVYHDSTVNMTQAVMRYLEKQANALQAASGNTSSATSR